MTPAPEASIPLPLWIVALIPVAFMIGFPLFWCFVVWLVAVFSGWRRLAVVYGSRQAPEGRPWWGQSGTMGLGRYNHLLQIHTHETGLWLETTWLFRAGHPRLFIPWSDLHNITFKPFPFRKPFWGRETVSLEVGSPRIATLTLPAEIIRETGRDQAPDEP